MYSQADWSYATAQVQGICCGHPWTCWLTCWFIPYSSTNIDLQKRLQCGQIQKPGLHLTSRMIYCWWLWDITEWHWFVKRTVKYIQDIYIGDALMLAHFHFFYFCCCQMVCDVTWWHPDIMSWWYVGKWTINGRALELSRQSSHFCYIFNYHNAVNMGSLLELVPHFWNI